MREVIWDALSDSLMLLPVLLAAHILIELIEHRAGGITTRLLNGKLSPLIGTAAGTLPQCGFGVAATKLYTKKHIALGTLLAVYIATSDEAIPVLLSDFGNIKKLLPLLAIKTAAALIVGYSVNFFVWKFKDKGRAETEPVGLPHGDEEHSGHEHGESGKHCECKHSPLPHGEKDDGCRDECTAGCHGHKVGCNHGEDGVFKRYFVHPLAHTATVFCFVFLINLGLGLIIHFIGQDALESFMQRVGVLQPFFAALIGLIPNCAASVAVTRMYAAGYLGLGAAVAGLSASAGLGYAVLIKENKNRLHPVLIILGMFAFSVILGMCVYLICG